MRNIFSEFWKKLTAVRGVLWKGGVERRRRRHLRLGRLGERIAEDYLCSRGYEMLCRNFRYRKSEIDLVMRLPGMLCLIEVKTRRWKPGVMPASAIDAHKEKMIFQGGIGYLRKIGSPPLLIRFDCVEVLTVGPFPVEVRHRAGEAVRIPKRE